MTHSLDRFRNLSSSFSQYVSRIGATLAHITTLPEEAAPDIRVGSRTLTAQLLGYIPINTAPQATLNFRFFIDGVQQTVPVFRITINGISVPVMASHLAAGAMERRDSRLVPYYSIDALVLLMPLTALRAAGWQGPAPPGIQLDSTGNFCNKIGLYEQQGTPLYSDTGVTLEVFPTSSISASELYASGNIRRKARDRASVILRVMELIVLWRVVSHANLANDEFVLIDGPLFMPFRYSRLADNALAPLESFNNASTANLSLFNRFFRNTLGLVKRVEIVPHLGLDRVFQATGTYQVPLYLFQDVVPSADDEVSSHTISAFLRLRPEILPELQSIWSPVSGLIRLDIPFGAISSPNENWADPGFQPNLHRAITDPTSRHYRVLQGILETALRERWPIPESESPHRMLTEYYAIAETEKWLRAMLLQPQQIRALFIGP